MSSLPEHWRGEKTHFSRDEKSTINSSTCLLANLFACWFANHCNLFSKNFNIMSALFIHQPLT